jgi:hypothetical protein
VVIVPSTLSLIVCAALVLLGALLLASAWRGRPPRMSVPDDAPVDPSRYGPALTNRWLRGIRTVFLAACIVALGFHGFWVFGAPGSDEFDRIAVRDQRNRRLSEASLRGWVFDRTGRPERALAKYRLDGRKIVRDYPLRESAASLTGYSDFVYGSAGFERGFADLLAKPSSAVNTLSSPAPVGSDLTSTIDIDLQKEAFQLLAGRRGAVVVLSVPNSEVLAMVSSPSFDPEIPLRDDAAWRTLKENAVKAPELSPLTDRALKTYYLPGSTFKVLVAMAALESGLGEERFTCKGEGFVAPASRRPIEDDTGGSHGTIGLDDALKYSCNQYFAQMGLKLGAARLAQVAQRFGIETGAARDLRDTDLWHHSPLADHTDFVSAFGPPPSRVFLPPTFDDDFTPYSLAIESFGQGPNQMTMLQLALLAAGAASADGRLNRPSIELGLEPEALGQVCTPETAAHIRRMMKSVVDSGTAAGAFGQLRGRIATGGKTGTAQRIVTVYDPRTLEPRTRRNREGEDIVVRDTSTDALFIGFAPYENPQIAYAVIVEDGGHGGKAAAPIAVGVVRKALELKLITARPPTEPAPAPARAPRERPRDNGNR